jgi:hypothetical protein
MEEAKQKRRVLNTRGAFALTEKHPAILFVGRLDWIRTNDPHHVKVVL